MGSHTWHEAVIGALNHSGAIAAWMNPRTQGDRLALSR